LILGWGSAVYIFKEEGFFSSECTESYQRSILNGTCAESCVSQDAHFNSILVAAVASYEIGGAFFGWIFDQYGTGKTRIAVNVSQTVGILCLAFATQDTSWLLYLGAIIIGMSGIMVLVTNMQIGNLYGEKRALVVTFLNGVYDSSSCTFMLLKVFYELGATYRQLFLGLVSLTFIMWLRTFFCMPKHAIPWPPSDNYEFSWRDWKNTKQARESGSITSCKSDDRFLCKRWVDIKENLLTKNFVFMNLWYIVANLRHVFFISAFNAWVTINCDSECACVSTWTSFFGILQFFGVAVAPLMGAFINSVAGRFEDETSANNVSCGSSLVLASLLGILLSTSSFILESVGNDQKYIFIFTTCLFEIFFRSSVYSSQANYVATLFPFQQFGVLYGISMSIAGLTGFLSIPLFTFVMNNLQGSFATLDIFFIIGFVLVSIQPIITCFSVDNKNL